MSTADTLDLSRLGAPSLVAVDFAAQFAMRLAALKELWDEARTADPTLPAIDAVDLITDPDNLRLREGALNDIHLLQAINDAANALRLATAAGADLRHLAQTYFNTRPLVLVPGDATASPPVPPVLESDDELRLRAQLAPEAFPMFGLVPGGYVWRVRQLYGDRVKGVRALRRPNGHMHVIILARAGDGTPPEELIGEIQQGFNDEDAESQCSDIVTVLPARIVPVAVEVVLGLPRGPDPAVITAAARAAIGRLASDRHSINDTLHVRAIEAAATVGAVRYARAVAPTEDVVGGPDGAPWVTSITVTTEPA